MSMSPWTRRALLAFGALSALAAADGSGCGSDAASCSSDADELMMPVELLQSRGELLQSELHFGKDHANRTHAGHHVHHVPREAQHPPAARHSGRHVAAAPMPPSTKNPTWGRRHTRRHRRKAAQRFKAETAAAAGGAAALAELGSEVGTTTTESPTGVTANGSGDLTSFIETSLMYIVLICIVFVGFCYVRRRYPLVYSKNVTRGFALGGSLPVPPNSFSGWCSTSYYADLEKVADSVGLDQAMLLRFCDLCMSIMKWIGIPMICIGGTCNALFGGNAAGDDNMSLLSFGNIQYGNWLYYPYSVVVWMVVVFVHRKICAAQADFLQLRFKWLREMSRVRANTILVDGIPEEYQRDDLLFNFFDSMFPGDSVKDAHCVKDSGPLLEHWQRRKQLRASLREAEAIWQLSGQDPEKRPQHSPSRLSWAKVDSIEAYQKELAEVEDDIKADRERLEEDCKTAGGANLSMGFVTFTERSFAEIALAVNVDEDLKDWVIENPPSPQDILWKDLKQDPTARAGREWMGIGLILGLYCAYLPLVVVITNLADLISFSSIDSSGILDDLWGEVAPTMGLEIMVAFLPTFLMIIFKNFFTLKAGAWAQHKVQTVYFWFNVVFVLMIAAVGTDFFDFADALLTDPFSVFDLLGEALPTATHYYWNYVVLQWFTHFYNLTRWSQYSKFKAFSAIFPEDEAANMCEPEDQDYYGLGSRSARFTTFLCIGLIYGTMAPPLNLLVWVNFFICRTVYGYLMIFAETKKTDLGGVFWATQLGHVYVGLMIYVVAMTGVFYCRVHPEATIVEDSDDLTKADLEISAPVVISALAIPYVIWARRKFEKSYNWERLPFSEVFNKLDENAKKRQDKGNYMQPECLPEDLEDVDAFDSTLMSHKAAAMAALAGTQASAKSAAASAKASAGGGVASAKASAGGAAAGLLGRRT